METLNRIDEIMEKRNCVEVTNEENEYERLLENVSKFKEIIKSEGKEVDRFLPKEMFKEKCEGTRIYKTFSVVYRGIEFIIRMQVENTLKTIWQGISYLAK